MFYALKQPLPNGFHIFCSADPKEVIQQVTSIEAKIFQVTEDVVRLIPKVLEQHLSMLDQTGVSVSIKEVVSTTQVAAA